jgi:hypothetical protein
MNGSQVTCETLPKYLESFSLVYACDVVKNGAIRIATPFTYPNGSHIDLFLKSKGDLFDSYILSDYGQTADYLAEMDFNLWATKKRRQTVTDICYSLGVRYNANMFEIEVINDDLKNLPTHMVRLTQACIRITDLSFTHRLQTYATFDAEIEEYIALNDLYYETEPQDLIGVYKKPVKVDFKVKGKSSRSLVQTWSTRNPYTSHTLSNEIFVRWLSLQPYKQSYQFITVYDDTSLSARDDDFARLYETSTVFAFPTQREQFRETISL